jgi:hypothetical protein
MLDGELRVEIFDLPSPPPILGERRHRSLAPRLVAVRRRAVLMMPKDQRKSWDDSRTSRLQRPSSVGIRPTFTEMGGRARNRMAAHRSQAPIGQTGTKPAAGSIFALGIFGADFNVECSHPIIKSDAKAL